MYDNFHHQVSLGRPRTTVEWRQRADGGDRSRESSTRLLFSYKYALFDYARASFIVTQRAHRLVRACVRPCVRRYSVLERVVRACANQPTRAIPATVSISVCVYLRLPLCVSRVSPPPLSRALALSFSYLRQSRTRSQSRFMPAGVRVVYRAFAGAYPGGTSHRHE